MRSLALVVMFGLLVGCVGEPPVPCTTCGDSCVDLRVDPSNCGSCGVACGSGKICGAGVCKDTCPLGQQACGGKCIDFQIDANNCGTCGNSCGNGKACVAGSCADSCPGTQTVCGSACADTQVDSSNCGACGMACAAGSRCLAGACATTCGAPQVSCSGQCADTQTSAAHCGMCGMPCATGEVCAAGACRAGCNAPMVSCAGGLCVDTQNNPLHCGGCGLACAPQNVTAPSCAAGSCGYAACAAGFVDCDGDVKNGCEAPTASCVILVSVGLDGGSANGPSSAPAVDRAGARVVFLSEATNLVPGDTNGLVDVFLRDLRTGQTTRLSTLPDGGEIQSDAGALPSYVSVAISGDGRTVGVSTNMQLILPDTNGFGADAILFNPDGGRSYGALASNPQNTQPTGNTNTFGPLFISDDGNLVTYMTRASGLFTAAAGPVAGGGSATGESNIYQYDRAQRLMSLPSINAVGQYVTSGALGFNAFPSWTTHNGRYVVYNTFGDNVVAGPNDSCSHIYLRDQVLGTTSMLAGLDNGAQLPCLFQNNSAGGGHVTPDGVTASFNTRVLLPGSAIGPLDNVYVRNLRTLKSTLISVAADGGVTNGLSAGSALTEDGQLVAFLSDATNLIPSDTNGQRDCFVVELSTRKLTRLNEPVAVPSPDGGAGCTDLGLSGQSHAVIQTRDGLLPSDQNNLADIYLRRLR